MDQEQADKFLKDNPQGGKYQETNNYIKNLIKEYETIRKNN